MLRVNRNSVYSKGKSVIPAKLTFRCCLDAVSVLFLIIFFPLKNKIIIKKSKKKTKKKKDHYLFP